MTVAVNRRARFDYHLEDSFEAGIILSGTEASVVRQQGFSLAESFVMARDGEVFLHNAYIGKHKNAHKLFNHEPKCDRKLLLKKREIEKIIDVIGSKGWNVIPVKAYYKNGRLKIEIAIGKGKREIDKRETIKRRIDDREAERAMKEKSY